jgi:hypothetical protein
LLGKRVHSFRLSHAPGSGKEFPAFAFHMKRPPPVLTPAHPLPLKKRLGTVITLPQIAAKT